MYGYGEGFDGILLWEGEGAGVVVPCEVYHCLSRLLLHAVLAYSVIIHVTCVGCLFASTAFRGIAPAVAAILAQAAAALMRLQNPDDITLWLLYLRELRARAA